MTIEQRPELNRFVDPSIPLTWAWRWRQFKMTLPIWLFILAFGVEFWLFESWLSSNWHWDRPLVLFGGWLAIILFVLGVAESQVRIEHRSKRLIKFQERKIILKPCKSDSLLWKKPAKFQFEPIPEMPGMTKLKIFLHGFPNQKPSGRAFWQMVLENPSQAQELIRFLQTRKTEIPTNYEIKILERPAPAQQAVPFPFLGMSLYMSGIFLLLHGGPLLLASFTHSHHDADGGSKFTPEKSAKLVRFFAQHFYSKAEFHHFFLALSIGLIGTGVALLILGWRLMGRKPRVEQAPSTV